MRNNRRTRYLKTPLQKTSSLGGSRALVWLDMEPLLEKERLRCEKTAHNLEKAKKELERFRDDYEPAYSCWFHGQFGEKMTQVRQLESKAAELEHFISSVRAEALHSGCSEHAAYAHLESMRLGREHMDEMGTESEGSFSTDDAEASAHHSEDEDELPPGMEEFLRMGFESLFGGARVSPKQYASMFESFKQSFKEDVLGKRGPAEEEEEEGPRHNSQRSSPRNQRTSRAQEDLEESRRKQVYRDLARKLHPDVNGALSSREKELWYEVQAAYEARSLERLETLAAIAESGSAAGFLKVQSVSRLRAILNDFGKKLKATQKALRQAKKQPAWEFHQARKDPKKLKELSRQIAHELQDVAALLQRDISSFEKKIECWKVPPPARKRHSQQKRAPRPAPRRQKRSAGMSKAEMDAYTGFWEKG